MPTVNIPGVALVRAGTWNASTGRVTISKADLRDMATAAQDPDVDAAPIKLGHVDPRFDGEPALGWVKNLRLSSDGSTLLGDLVDVPAALADIIPTAYARRSVEIAWGTEAPDGTKRGAVLTGLALLGVSAPAVKGLADVYTATAGDADTGDTAHSVALATDTHGIPLADTQPGEPADVSQDTTTPPEDTMTTKATTAAASGTATEAPDAATTAPADGTEPGTGTAPAAEATPDTVQASAAPTLPAGTVLVDATVLAQLTAGAQAGVAAQEQLDKQRRDGIIETALRAGKITPKSAEDVWRPQLDENEAGVVALLATLPDNTVPVVAFGHGQADANDPLEQEWAALSASFTQEV